MHEKVRTTMSSSRLQQTINHYRQQLAQHEATAERVLNTAHAHTLSVIQPMLDKLYQQISQKQQNGETVSLSWLYQDNRLNALKQMISNQVNHYGALALMTVGQIQHTAVQIGTQSAQQQLHATVPGGVRWSFGVADPGAIVNLVGATQKGSPLADLFAGFGDEAAEGASKALVTGVSLGQNPRRIAPQVEQALEVPRWRALTIARTEMLRSYRGSQLANYQANSDTLDGWIWTAALNSRTCAACIAMNGTVHSLDEPMASHVNCRCTQTPKTKSWEDILSPLGIDVSHIKETSYQPQTGIDWFEQQDESVQRSILGSNKAYDLYKSGDVGLKDFVGHSHDADWGDSVFVKPLKDLVKS